jgi:hypothetical protein
MAITLAEWRKRIRRRMGDYESTFIVDGADGYCLDTEINEAITTAYEFLLTAFKDNLITCRCFAQVAANASNTYIETVGAEPVAGGAFAVKPFKILSVEFDFCGVRYPMQRLDLPRQLTTTVPATQAWTPGNVFYHVSWEHLETYPVPASAQYVYLLVAPKPQVLTLETDTLLTNLSGITIGTHPVDAYP